MPTNVNFSYKTVAKADRGKLLDKIIKEQSKRLFQNTKMIRNELDTNGKIQVDRQNDFFTSLRKAIGKLNATQIQNIIEYASVETFGELSAALNKLKSALDDANMVALRNARGQIQWEHDHITQEPINVAITVTIIALVDCIQDMQRGVDFTDTGVGANTGLNSTDVGGLKNIVNELRVLRKMGDLLENDPSLTPAEMRQIIENDGFVDISTLKDKDLGFKDGVAATISTTLTTVHGAKSAKQQQIGGAKFALLNKEAEVSDQFVKDLITEIKAVQVDRITGSKSLKKARQENISKLVRGQKTKSAKVKSRSQLTRKGTKSNIPARLGKHLVKETSADIGRAVAILDAKIGSAKKKRKTGREAGDKQRDLNLLRTKINTRLGAAVRRNMGRPALNNRTGRFSDSVVLLNLYQRGETQVAGDYTYLLSPYETFENTGEKQWPTGYNPNPLIKRSIRETAEAVAEDRFTFYLRRV